MSSATNRTEWGPHERCGERTLTLEFRMERDRFADRVRRDDIEIAGKQPLGSCSASAGEFGDELAQRLAVMAEQRQPGGAQREIVEHAVGRPRRRPRRPQVGG